MTLTKELEGVVVTLHGWDDCGGEGCDICRCAKVAVRAALYIVNLEATLKQTRDVLNADLKTASERVLTLELENQRLQAALAAAPSSPKEPVCLFMQPQQLVPCSTRYPHDQTQWCGACLLARPR